MKTLLIMTLLLLVSCGGKPPSVPALEKCLNGDETVCPTLPDTQVEENNVPTPTPEPVVEPLVQEPSLYYNSTMHLKSFSFYQFNFETLNSINLYGETVFKSNNWRQIPLGSQYVWVYAKIYFKNGQKAKIDYLDNNNVVRNTYYRHWTMTDDWVFHIDGYQQNSFGWHSVVHYVEKTNEEKLQGMNRDLTPYKQITGQQCKATDYFLVTVTECWDIWHWEYPTVSYFFI